ncbi:hypothetical protein [Acetobacter sacchari]
MPRSLLSLLHAPRKLEKAMERSPEAGAVVRFNDWLAVRMTVIFGSIWCVYAFTVFSLIPMVAPGCQNTLLYISNAIQLIALPALAVGSAILARSSEARADADHAALVEILDDVRQELTELRSLTSGIAANQAQDATGGTTMNVSADTFIAVDNIAPDAPGQR